MEIFENEENFSTKGVTAENNSSESKNQSQFSEAIFDKHDSFSDYSTGNKFQRRI